MQDAIIEALISKLQPAFYGIGILTVLLLIAFGGTILKMWLDSGKSKEHKTEAALEALQKSISDNTIQLVRMQAKLEIYIKKHEQNYNDLGKKIRSLTV